MSKRKIWDSWHWSWQWFHEYDTKSIGNKNKTRKHENHSQFPLISKHHKILLEKELGNHCSQNHNMFGLQKSYGLLEVAREAPCSSPNRLQFSPKWTYSFDGVSSFSCIFLSGPSGTLLLFICFLFFNSLPFFFLYWNALSPHIYILLSFFFSQGWRKTSALSAPRGFLIPLLLKLILLWNYVLFVLLCITFLSLYWLQVPQEKKIYYQQ